MNPASRDGAAALDDVRAFIGRFCALPTEHAYTAATLWAAHAHVLDAFDSTPRLAFLSPEPGSGKTRALEILTLLVPWPMHAVNATPAALFRSVADKATRRTILFDEIDTIFGPKAKEHEELRGLLNAGHRRSGVAYRCVGEGTKQTVVEFPAFAAVALAGLGKLPDTILTRSIVIRMRRRAPDEHIEPYRARIHEPEGWKLRGMLADWTATVAEQLTGYWPEMPPGVTDRPADVWEPLLAVADAAGGPWPDRARDACAWLVRDNADRGISLGIRLLADLRDIFGGARAMTTEDILTRLRALDAAPWADLKGAPLDARGLARLLDDYDITSKKVKVDGRSALGLPRRAPRRRLDPLPPAAHPGRNGTCGTSGTRTPAVGSAGSGGSGTPATRRNPPDPPLTCAGSGGSAGSGLTAEGPASPAPAHSRQPVSPGPPTLEGDTWQPPPLSRSLVSLATSSPSPKSAKTSRLRRAPSTNGAPKEPARAASNCPTGNCASAAPTSKPGSTHERTPPDGQHHLRRAHLENRNLQRGEGHHLQSPVEDRPPARGNSRSGPKRKRRASRPSYAPQPAEAKRSTSPPAAPSPGAGKTMTCPGMNSACPTWT